MDLKACSKHSQEQIEKKIIAGSHVSEGTLLSQQYKHKQFFYLFLHLLKFQGSYTNGGNNPSFWFPVQSEEQDVIIVMCKQIFVYHSCSIDRLFKLFKS